MKPALNPTTIKQGLDLPTFINIAAKAGFQGIEFSITDAAAYAQRGSMSALRDLFHGKGIAPAQWGLPMPFMVPEPDFQQALSRLPPVLEVAQGLEADTAMIVVPFRTRTNPHEATRTLAAQVKRCARVSADHGIRLALEFIGLRFETPGEVDFITDLRTTLDLVHEIDEKNVGVMLDCFHFYTGGSEIADLRSMTGDLLYMIHLDDAPPGEPKTLTDQMRVLPGKGVIGVAEMLRECACIGYQGFASLELFGDQLRQMDPLGAAKIGYQSVMSVLPQPQL